MSVSNSSRAWKIQDRLQPERGVNARFTALGARLDSNQALEIYRAAFTGASATNNIGAVINQNDTTNNPIALKVINAGTGNGLFIDQNGNGISLNIDSEATTANVVDISAATLTTGKAIDLSDLDAITTGKALHVDATGVTHTTGILVHIDSAATALTGVGRLLLVDHTGATTTSGVIAEVKSAGADETILMQLQHAGTGDDLKIINTNGGALGPKIELYHNVGDSAAADDDVVGRILFAADDEEAASAKHTVGQIDIQWTDATAASYASDLELYLAVGAAANLALTLSGGGQMGLDLDSDLSASSAAGQIFDDYDDARVLQKYAYIGVVEPEISMETIAELEAMGIVEKNEQNQRGYMLKLQPFLRLLCGGIYQTRQMLEALSADLRHEMSQLKPA